MAVQNASIQTQDTTPKPERRDDTRNARRVIVDPPNVVPETTESYRGPIRNVERVFAPGNDNQKGGRQPGPKKAPPPKAGKGARVPNIAGLNRNAQAVIGKAKRLRALGPAVSLATIPYCVQLAFAIISLIGLSLLGGVDSTIGATIDTVGFGSISGLGEALFVIGLVGALLSGCAVAAAITPALKAAGAHPGRGFSLLVGVVCAWMHLWPILNLFPIMALWCLYVIIAD